MFQYVLVDPSHGQAALRLRRLQDDVVGPALASIPGVVEVASLGGETQEVAVETRGGELQARGLAFSDVVSAVRAAAAAGPIDGLAAIKALSVRAPSAPAAPTRFDRGRGRVSASPPRHAERAGRPGRPVVRGRRHRDRERGADPAAGHRRGQAELDRQRARLPRGVELVRSTIGSSSRAASSARCCGRSARRSPSSRWSFSSSCSHLRSALVPLVTLPVVLLLTFAAMWLLDVPATIMSLGGHRHRPRHGGRRRRRRAGGLPPPPGGPGGRPRPRRSGARDLARAAAIFAPAILTSLVIAALTFLPVFAFTGETGRLLRPLVVTKTLVFGSAAVLVALTLGAGAARIAC